MVVRQGFGWARLGVVEAVRREGCGGVRPLPSAARAQRGARALPRPPGRQRAGHGPRQRVRVNVVERVEVVGGRGVRGGAFAEHPAVARPATP